jgi:paraquat-inducible protein B
MSQKANPTSIGLFIVVGLALGVTGLLLFSSSKLFTQTIDCVVYFSESLNGLNEGAPVKYRGVTVGSVKRVMIRLNQASNDYSMPVIVEIEEKLLRERRGDEFQTVFDRQSLEQQVNSGLRATLETESLVTGVLYIDMRIHPEAPPPVFHQLRKRYSEIPAVPTQITKLFNNLASLDIKSIETNLNDLLTKLTTTVSGARLAEISQSVTNVLRTIDLLVASPAITNAIASVPPTLEQYRLLGERLNRGVDPLVGSVTNSLAEANRALAQMRGAGENLRVMLAPDSPLHSDLDRALDQLAGAAQSISSLVEFLKQHPNAIIAGRQLKKKEP